MIKVVENNENKTICAACGGKCCKRLPGEWSVEDVLKRSSDGSIKSGLSSLLDAGLLQFDWWDGDIIDGGKLGAVYLPRPPCGNGGLFYASWGRDICHLLTSGGCSLSFDDRPEGCKAMIPSADGECRYIDGHYTKSVAALEWRPYQNTILQTEEEHERTMTK